MVIINTIWVVGGNKGGYTELQQRAGSGLTEAAGDHSHVLIIDETGGLENRSRNIALRAIIRVG